MTDDDNAQPEVSRRGFMTSTLVADLFGFDFDMPTLGGSPASIWVAAPEETGAYVDITPESTPALVFEPDGSVYSWDIADAQWRQLNGGGGGVLEDSGSDNSDGGDNYQFPAAEDALDLQGTGDILNAASIDTYVETIADTATQPTANGEIRRDGNDLYLFSGGAARNASNIGSGSFAISASSSVSLSFGTWRQPDASNPVSLLIECKAQTDGNSTADVRLEVDESGGTTADYNVRVAYADADSGAGHSSIIAVERGIPAGAQYRLINDTDPAGANSIVSLREATL